MSILLTAYPPNGGIRYCFPESYFSNVSNANLYSEIMIRVDAYEHSTPCSTYEVRIGNDNRLGPFLFNQFKVELCIFLRLLFHPITFKC